MGNIVLPNALPPEMGVINYIHTLYSSRLTTQSFFDERFDDEDSPLRMVFGTQLGHMPSSIWNNGSYLKSPCFRDRVMIYENSVYFGARNTLKWIYPIKVTLHFDKFTGIDSVGSKLNGEYFWKHISDYALKQIRSKAAVIFLDWANENFIERTEYCNLHQALQYSGIPPSQVVLSVNSFNAQEIYESWFSPEERKLEVRNLPFLVNHISYNYFSKSVSGISDSEFRATRNTPRKNYFVYPSRRGRDHRLALLYKLHLDGLLEKGDWSSLDPKDATHLAHMAHSWNFEVNDEKIRSLQAMLPHSLEEEQGSTFNSVAGWNDRHNRPQLNSYLYIATETYTHGVYKSLTEKVFKPLANFQPFVFMAYPGALETLRSLGFKTFDGWIDESYDKEPDQVKRMHMIVEEIRKICDMTPEQVHNWYWSMEEILYHNRERTLNIHKDEPYSLEFIKYLVQKVS